jgi:hypothetical protein
MRRVLAWFGGTALIVLTSRSVVYALSPSPLAAGLAHHAGGPALPAIAAVSLGLAVALSAAILSLAAIGVAERKQLETRRVGQMPRLRLELFCWRAIALTLVSCLAFALLESYIHWRAGLGWHGLNCLTGPVHRDAIPVLAGFSIVGAALAAALDHVLAWMRRTLARLAPAPRLATRRLPPGLRPLLAPVPATVGPALARGPPAAS